MKLLNTKEAAQKLSISEKSLYRWVAEKKIPYVRLSPGAVRFSEEKLNKWIEARMIGTTVAGVKI